MKREFLFTVVILRCWLESLLAQSSCDVNGNDKSAEVECKFLTLDDDSPVTSHIALRTKTNSRNEAKTLDVLNVRLIFLNFFIQC